MRRGSSGEQPVWDKYAGDPAALADAAKVIRVAIEDEEVNLTRLYEDEDAEEGALRLRVHLSRERKTELSNKRKALALQQTGTLRCEVCNFDFAATYGELGIGYIEAHHTRPISTLAVGHRTKLSELALVCANCHRMLHRQADPADLDGLKAALRR